MYFSTNGTVINMSKLVKKQTHMLQSGDIIYFVYRKSEPEQSELFSFFSIAQYFYMKYKRKRKKNNILSCHTVDIAYVYHSIQMEHATSGHTYGKQPGDSPQVFCQM